MYRHDHLRPEYRGRRHEGPPSPSGSSYLANHRCSRARKSELRCAGRFDTGLTRCASRRIGLRVTFLQSDEAINVPRPHLLGDPHFFSNAASTSFCVVFGRRRLRYAHQIRCRERILKVLRTWIKLHLPNNVFYGRRLKHDAGPDVGVNG